MYVADITSVSRVVITSAGPEITLNWGTGMSNPSSITVDTLNAANPVVYVGDDPTGGNGQLQGRVFRISETVAPAAPGRPINVVATAGDRQATVSWTPGADGGTPTTRYIVRTFRAADDTPGAPDLQVNVTPPAVTPPTTATVTGLVNGTAYYFTVDATNAVGTSPQSAPSSPPVTPRAAVVPSAPLNVSAIAGNAAVAVAWTPPLSNGGSPIDSYTITYSQGGPEATTEVPGNVTGTVIDGLMNNTTYLFRVRATNAVGDGPDSANSNPATPTGAAPQIDMELTMSGPEEVLAGGNATYTLIATNVGGLTVPQAVVTYTLPASGATFGSVTSTRGACLRAAATVTCNLGSLAPNLSATVTVVLTNITANITNSATVQANDAAGVLLDEQNVANNRASVTTSLAVPPPPQTTTDLQVSGAASNGGPRINTAISYTWQVRNSGKDVANNVVFTDVLPSSLRFNAVTATLGGQCTSTTTPGSAGGTATCTLATLNVGQTLSITINATPTILGAISNTGQVTFDGTDTNPANNVRTVTINVR